LQALTDLGQFSRCEVNSLLLYFASVSLLVSPLLLTVSALAKRLDLHLDLRHRARKVGQLTGDQRDVGLGRHLRRSLSATGVKVS
jgi:hypothetical protein